MLHLVIHVNLTKDSMPTRHQTVIVAGGLAVWTGSVWLSKTGDDSGTIITWPVKWWTPLIQMTDINYLPEAKSCECE